MNDGVNEQFNETAENKNISPDKKSSPLNDFIDYIELFVIAVCVVILLFTIAFRTCTVDGHSMNNTLIDGEVLLVSDMLYTPDRGDVIVFHNNDGTMYNDINKPLVKRVIGVGGDTVTINHNTQKVTVKNAEGEVFDLDEEYVYLDPTSGNSFSGEYNYVVPEGKLFVMGDNRRGSLDSRYALIGFVDERCVLGRVYFRIAPLQKFGVIK